MSKKNLLNEAQIRQFMKLASLEPLTTGFVEGLTENTDDLDEARKKKDDDLDEARHSKDDEDRKDESVEELEELRTGRSGALGPADGTHPSRGRGQGEAASGAMNEDAEEVEEGTGMYRDDDMGDDMDMGDDGGDQMISVKDLLQALESALEDVTGQPVDASVEGDDDMDVDVDVDDDGDDMDMDMDVDIDDGMMEEGDEDITTEATDEELEEGTKKGQELKKGSGKRGSKPGDEAFINEEDTDELVEQITKRVAARILKSALAKK